MSSSSVKVGGSLIKDEQKCPNNHVLKASVDPMRKFRCNYCRSSIPPSHKKFECRVCDFDICMKCSNM